MRLQSQTNAGTGFARFEYDCEGDGSAALACDSCKENNPSSETSSNPSIVTHNTKDGTKHHEDGDTSVNSVIENVIGVNVGCGDHCDEGSKKK